jgi:hypothetical protein
MPDGASAISALYTCWRISELRWLLDQPRRRCSCDKVIRPVGYPRERRYLAIWYS